MKRVATTPRYVVMTISSLETPVARGVALLCVAAGAVGLCVRLLRVVRWLLPAVARRAVRATSATLLFAFRLVTWPIAVNAAPMSVLLVLLAKSLFRLGYSHDNNNNNNNNSSSNERSAATNAAAAAVAGEGGWGDADGGDVILTFGAAAVQVAVAVANYMRAHLRVTLTAVAFVGWARYLAPPSRERRPNPKGAICVDDVTRLNNTVVRRIFHARTEQDVVDVVRKALRKGCSVRCVRKRH